MKENKNKITEISFKILPLVFVISCVFNHFIKGEWNLSDIRECLSISIIITIILTITIEKYLWKRILLFFKDKKIIWNLIESYETPILKEKYNCKIKYEWQGVKGNKNSVVKINQTYTSISVTVMTDEIESTTIISDIVKVDNKFILYYIYRTNPKSEFNEMNPMQLGGCKIILDSIEEDRFNEKLIGKYWTTSKTTGDLELYV